MKNREFELALDLTQQIKNETKAFFKEGKNQTESIILEYKASFAYDTALALCPFCSSDKKNLLNDALSLRILETIIGFANTSGGLLIIGVAEKKGRIVDRKHQEICTEKYKEHTQKPRCFQMGEPLACPEIGNGEHSDPRGNIGRTNSQPHSKRIRYFTNVHRKSEENIHR